jgi:beta-phosphoglucomutase-like phosphatase (HAD superfamily)
MISTVLFDLDGVLTDTHDLQYSATRKAILEYSSFDIDGDNEYKKVFNTTITTCEKLKILVEDQILKMDDIEQVYTLKKEHANEIFKTMSRDNTKIELFRFLKLNNINIGIVTNGNRASAIIILKTIGVWEYVDKLVANDDCIKNKPNSEPYIRAMMHFGGILEGYLILEDSDIGLTSARNTGCRTYHVKSIDDVNISTLSGLINL